MYKTDAYQNLLQQSNIKKLEKIRPKLTQFENCQLF